MTDSPNFLLSFFATGNYLRGFETNRVVVTTGGPIFSGNCLTGHYCEAARSSLLRVKLILMTMTANPENHNNSFFAPAALWPPPVQLG